MKAALILAAVVLTGCSTTQGRWAGSGSEHQFHMDRGSCIQATYTATFAPVSHQMAIFSGCMQSKGWYYVN